MESKSFLVDSNVFIAFYNQDDSQHQSAISLLQDLESHSLIVHPYVIQEVATVLTYRFGIATAKKFLKDILQAKNIFIAPVEINSDIEFFDGMKDKISFTDVSLINLAERINASLLTFDQQVIKIIKRGS